MHDEANGPITEPGSEPGKAEAVPKPRGRRAKPADVEPAPAARRAGTATAATRTRRDLIRLLEAKTYLIADAIDAECIEKATLPGLIGAIGTLIEKVASLKKESAPTSEEIDALQERWAKAIKRHVTDPDTLTKIADDIARSANNTTGTDSRRAGVPGAP